MAWFGWILVVLFVILSFALLCYSVVATGLEIGRKVQPFVDSFFDFVATISGTPDPELHALRHQAIKAVVKYLEPLAETASPVT